MGDLMLQFVSVGRDDVLVVAMVVMCCDVDVPPVLLASVFVFMNG